MSTGQADLHAPHRLLAAPHRLLAKGSGLAFSLPCSSGVMTAPIGPL